MLLCSISVLGLFISLPWLLVDAFLIPGMVNAKRAVLRQKRLSMAAV